jgi:hypothetical protein
MTRSVPHHHTMAITLIALAAALSACTSYDPRTADSPPPLAPTATPVVTPDVTPAPTATPTASAAGPIESAHVTLTVATSNAVMIDVKDSSRTLLRAESGKPGDGATVEPYALIVKNLTPTTIRLTWTGGPCDSTDQLFIDKARKQLLLVQPGCSGDAVATDRMLDLTFSAPINASALDASLQDGLDT